MAATQLLIYVALLLFFHLSTSSPTRGSRGALSITSYAALGDSYAAGPGAGSPRYVTEQAFVCGRFSNSYPRQVANDSRLSIKHSSFKHVACAGATITSVLHHQVPYIGHSDLVSVTVGGNEVDFLRVLNECIYQWHPVSTCDAALVESRKLLESPVLRNNFDALIAGAVRRLKADALLLVTGYAGFFNDQTDICDHVTFSRTRPLDYLTKAKRKAFNQLVDMLNDVIRAIADTHGAVYVDVDSVFEGHRFCEEGVHEPDLQREDTWFFNLPAPEMEVAADNREQVVQLLDITKEDHKGVIDDTGFPSMTTLRVLHPTSMGHHGISKQIVRVLEALGRLPD
ncbi:hypothetical protein A1O1_04799 [Capronia coronata CBS 617.96]|uniref:SGNH hydrolase-type esterase domain-containing protein n=1 Tax=Capronia coronata CBS 617.96 TaxID=1182541 RepID=W9Y510_9EURO|nr:uncharacterized protein A1O1_04799 [Capronia coronata CBS 617.96]EXJ87872.1 hypothetical protein A1O1_04799 [Capronia coronata CBS 617.96]